MSDGLAAEERKLLEEIAEAVVRRGMALPAMMFLETVSPMNMLSASMLHMASPMWRMILPASRIDMAARLLERREAIPALLSLIDERDQARRGDQPPTKPSATPSEADPLQPPALAAPDPADARDTRSPT